MTQAHQLAPGRIGDSIIHLIPCGGRESHNSDTPLVVGAFLFNPLNYAMAKTSVAFSFSIIAANGVSPLTTHAKLYNVTDGEDVTLSILNVVNSTATARYQALLTTGAGAGLIKLAEKIYECRIYLDAPPGNPATDTIELYKAELRAVFTVL